MKDFNVRLYTERLFGGVTAQNFFTGFQIFVDPSGKRQDRFERQFTVPSTVIRTESSDPSNPTPAPAPATPAPTAPPAPARPSPAQPGAAPANSSAGSRPPRIVPRGTPSVFGIATHAPRVVFVVDVSGSMYETVPGGGTRLSAALDQVAGAVEDLEPGREFNIVLFAGSTLWFAGRPVPADEDVKHAALQFLRDDHDLDGVTDLGAGIVDALSQQPGEIILVTDGLPNTRLDTLFAEVADTQERIGRPARIHAVGCCVSAGGGAEAFLQRLCAAHRGTYRAWKGTRLTRR